MYAAFMMFAIMGAFVGYLKGVADREKFYQEEESF